MGALKRASAVVALLLTIAPARAGEVGRWRPFVADASARFQVPIEWIERVIAIESRGKTVLDGRPITSRAGAMGLMQLMPQTWAAMRAKLALGDNPHDPKDNILAGTCYMRLMYDRFGYPGLFAAYNAGPARYADALAGHRRLPQETSVYLVRAAGARSTAEQGRPLARLGHPTLFFITSTVSASGQRLLPPSDVFMLRAAGPAP